MTGSDEPAARALNQLAREQMIKRLLADINADLTVCRLEGWDAGECIDILKKHLFQGHELNRTKLIDELGDVQWYIAETAAALGVSLEEIMEQNIEKLRRRYPEGFDSERSVHRVT